MSLQPPPAPLPDFRLLFESAPSLYLVLAPDFSIVAVTDAYLHATMTSRENILGRNIFEVFPDNPEDKQATGARNLRESLDHAVAARSPDTMAVQKYDIRRPDSEGGGFEERYWSPLNTPVYRDGKLAYILHRVEDVTEFIRLKRQRGEQSRLTEGLRQRAEQMELEIFQRAQELQEANRGLRKANENLAMAREAAESAKKRAEDASREFEAFSYSVSHDLMAPLRAMDGYSRILLDKYSGGLVPEAKDYLGRIRGGARKMSRLIDDLLELARVSHKQPVSAPLDLSRLALEVIARIQDGAPGRKVDFEVEPGISALGDIRFLEIVLDNLLRNAFKFTGRKESARIGFGSIERDGEPVYFVRDDGAGFDMRFADKLFGTFQRLHPALEFDGTGIGLATVQRIIHRHGGRIWAQGEPGKGATFFFTLARE